MRLCNNIAIILEYNSSPGGGMVDTRDLKSFGSNAVRVRVSSRGCFLFPSRYFHAIFHPGRTPIRTGACPRREAGGTSGIFIYKRFALHTIRDTTVSSISMKAFTDLISFSSGNSKELHTAASNSIQQHMQ